MMYLHVFQDVNHLNVMTGGIGPELTVAAVRRLTPSSVCGQLWTSEAVADFARTEGFLLHCRNRVAFSGNALSETMLPSTLEE